MNKLILILGLLLVIPSAYSLSNEEWKTQDFQNNILSVETKYTDEFKYLVATEEVIKLMDSEGVVFNITDLSPKEPISYGEFNDEDYWVASTGSGSFGSWHLFNEEGVNFTRSVLHDIEFIETYDDKIFFSPTSNVPEVRHVDDYVEWAGRSGYYSTYRPGYTGEIPGLDEKGVLATSTYGRVIAVTDEKEFQIWEVLVGEHPDADVYNDLMIFHGDEGVKAYDPDHNEKYSLDWNSSKSEVTSSGKIVSMNSQHLNVYNATTGSPKYTIPLENTPNDLEVFNQKHVALLNDSELQIIDLEGQSTLNKYQVGGNQLEIAFDDENTPIFSVIDGSKLKIKNQPIKQDFPDLKQKFSFYTTESEGFKPISTGNNVYVGRESGESDEESFNLGNEGSNSFNDDFNINKSKIYAKDSEKAVYVAPLANHLNKTITFDEDKADKFLESYDKEHLQSKIVDKFKPNHVVAGNFETEKEKLLAAEIATGRSALPINTTQDKLEQDLEDAFELIGVNKEVALDGKYVSLYGLGLEEREVNTKFYGSEEIETISHLRNKGYRTGYYPKDPVLASKMFSNSIDEVNSTSVAASYLSGTTPVVASTFGGGVRQGLELHGSIDEKFESEFYTERRADPVDFFLSITPGTLVSVAETGGEIDDIITAAISDTVGSLFSKFYIIIHGLNYAEELLYLSLEYDWTEIEFEPTAFYNEFELRDYSEDDELQDIIEEQLLDSVLSTFWPDPHNSIRTDISGSMKSDVLIYIGRGNSTHLHLPDGEDGWINNPYNNHVDYSKFNQTPGIIWDSTKTLNESKKLEQAAEKGTSTYITYSIPPESSQNVGLAEIASEKGGSIGESIDKATKLYRSNKILNTLGTPTSNAVLVFGDPETPFISRNSSHTSNNHRCNEEYCEVNLKVERSDFEEENSLNTLVTSRPGDVVNEIAVYEHNPISDSNITLKETEYEYALSDKRIPRNNYSLRTDGSHELLNTTQTPESPIRKDLDEGLLAIDRYKNTEEGLKEIKSSKITLRYTSDYSAETFTRNNTGFLKIRKPENSSASTYIDYDSKRKLEIHENTTDKIVELGNITNQRETVDVNIFEEGSSVYQATLELEKEPEVSKEILTNKLDYLSANKLKIRLENDGETTTEVRENLNNVNGLWIPPHNDPIVSKQIKPNETVTLEKTVVPTSQNNVSLDFGGKEREVDVKHEMNLHEASYQNMLSTYSNERSKRVLDINASSKHYKLDSEEFILELESSASSTILFYESDNSNILLRQKNNDFCIYEGESHFCEGDDIRLNGSVDQRTVKRLKEFKNTMQWKGVS